MYRMRPRQNPVRCPEGGVLTVRWLPLRPHLCHIEAVTCRRSRWGRLTSRSVGPVGVEPTTRGNLVGAVQGGPQCRFTPELHPCWLSLLGPLERAFVPAFVPGQGELANR